MAKLSPNQVAWAAIQGGFPSDKIALFTAIAGAESSYEPTARGHYTESGKTHYVYGLWQISDVHTDLMSRYNWADPVQNAQMANTVYKQQGLRAWEAYTNGSYLRYMADGIRGAANPEPISGTGEAPSSNTSTVQQAGLTDIPDAVGSFIDKVTDPYFWLRVGEIVGGSVLLSIGLAKMFGDSNFAANVKQGLVGGGMEVAADAI